MNNMYTIVMNDDKSLSQSIVTTIYQREKLVDKMRFLFPLKYGDIDLSKCIAVLKYTDQGNVAHSEILTLADELFENRRLIYYFPIDTDITRFAGDVTLRVTFLEVDMENGKRTEVLHTGQTTITVHPLEDYYRYVTDESLEIIDQVLTKFDARAQAYEKAAEAYAMEKADDFLYENNELQLLAQGKPIGRKATIVSDDALENGMPVVEFGATEEKPSDTPDGNYEVIEF